MRVFLSLVFSLFLIIGCTKFSTLDGPADPAAQAPSENSGNEGSEGEVADETAPGEGSPSTADGVKIAFIGDTQTGSGFQAVLDLIKAEKADLVIVAGDTDYGSGEANWDGMVRQTLPGEAALVAMGNHDYGDSNPDVVKQMGMARLPAATGLTCTGAYGEKMTCKFRGVYIVISSIGSGGGGQAEHEQYIKSQLDAADPGMWRICAWHKNQRLMQVGGKSDDVGWPAYESCRAKGALITTGHEHSYSRTHLLSNMENQSIAATGPEYTVEEGKTLAWVSGLGGNSVRDQQLSGTYWASIYTSNQGATDGVLFGTFQAKTASFVFKNVNNQVIDSFTVNKGY